MLRTIFEGVLLFLIPFAGFAVYLLIRRQNPLHPEIWSRKALSWLTISALLVCIWGVIVVGTQHENVQGTFIPSHVDKDGQFAPGRFKQ